MAKIRPFLLIIVANRGKSSSILDFFWWKAKKNGKTFAGNKKLRTFATANGNGKSRFHPIGVWCNGNTTDSGPVIPGSNPGTPTQLKPTA